MRLLTLLGLLLCSLILKASEDRASSRLPDGLYAEFTTPKGVFVARLFYERAPMTVANFVALAEGGYGRTADGLPLYEQLSWYRVVPGFVIQGGAELPPERFPGYPFPDEIVPGFRHDRAGILSMANSGPDTNNSMFFVTLGNAKRLNYLHTVFGYVERGLDVLPLIAKDDPFSIRILRVGRAAKKFQATEAAFLRLKTTAKKYAGEPDAGPNAHFDDPDHILPTDAPRANNFNFKLANFERFTGIRLFARIYARFSPTAPGQTPEDQAHQLAAKLGLEREGALAVYYADQQRWLIILGTNGKDPLPRDSAQLSSLLGVLFQESAQQAEAYAAQTIAARGKDNLTEADRVKYAVDAMLDGLIVRMEPRH